MTRKADIFPMREGESITDWTLRFLFDVSQERIETGQLVYATEENVQEIQRKWDYTKCTCENNGDYCEYCEGRRADADRRRLDDLYRASTPREAEVEE